jgi:very-short-patch-repair endonuclease
MSQDGEVLVAIINNPLDFAIAHEQHWYRIPVASVKRFINKRWPPQWLAFYQTKAFGDQAYAVHYYARVLAVRQVSRRQLFPDEPLDEKSNRRYYQLALSPLVRLPKPIASPRWRRIVFIPTTWEKFIIAEQINDLYDDSPLEDRLWAALKQHQIPANRQEYIQLEGNFYALDFAIYCAKGNIDVETDGDTWHANPERSKEDNLRDNAIETAGWKLLRFNTHHIQEKMEGYCLPRIVKNINKLGGVEEKTIMPRKISLDRDWRQPSLFDGLAPEDDFE